mmetsp:Transcript_11340/g.18760  ORF Transcript_11340/g.18760 Transcript_11340/m.18760 type:complete len:512 (+) Transcript_11340:28-1563(+)|eukprot:CAMPEP_0119031948 /NCGR_PEP_ID=MMETSP1176-20130426/41802_1 /TAXON_ID=265551 /ORGANISM="Synedropsis recta cf, Strain CCMP1620" /LENGTH=511 /DNA_ID=CAMNT_0006988355 /DNA_START=9 /DNA_END=1544 /DNA_ORIENTATION=+
MMSIKKQSLILCLFTVGLAAAGVGGADECTSQTQALANNEDVVFAYEAAHFTETSQADDPLTMYVFLDYTYSSNYQSVCEDNGGTYHGLYFNATCTTDRQGKAEKTENLVVTNFPRCYDSVCSPDEAQNLFEEFTLRPTEAVNARHGKSYTTCTGVVSNDVNDEQTAAAAEDKTAPVTTIHEEEAVPDAVDTTVEKDEAGAVHNDTSSSTCDDDKEQIEETPDIAKAFLYLKPKVEKESLTGIETAVISIDYHTDSTEAFRATCEENGFQYLESESFAMKCVKGSAELRSLVSFFPVCIGKDCDAGDANNFEAFVEHAFLHGFEKEAKDYTCTPIAYNHVVGTCSEQTEALEQQKDIIETFNAISPHINRLDLGTALRSADADSSRILIELDYDSNYTDAFSAACEDSGFVYIATDGFAMDCMDNTTTLEYRVKYFPQCVGQSCNMTESEYDFDTMKERAFLHSGSEHPENFECVKVVYEMEGVTASGLVFLYLILCIPCLLCHFCIAVGL